MPVGAPKGNKNAANAKLWNAAIHRALDQKTRLEGKEALDTLAMELIKKCEEGDLSALKEFGDRIEGKSAQSINVGGQADNPLKTINEVLITPLTKDEDETSNT